MTNYILSLLATLIGASIVVVTVLLLYVAIKCRLALWQFKKRSKGLPMYDDMRILGNSNFTLNIASDSCHKIQEAHKRLGKTFGYLSVTRYGVHTIDLDLMKRIIIDLGEVTRMKTDFPLSEIENSILLVNGNKWRKLRRNFAPAFKSSKFKDPNVLEEIDNSIQKLIDYIEARLDDQSVMVANRGRFEVDDMLHKYSLQVVFSCFYKQYNAIDFADENCYWVKVVDDMTEAVRSNIIPKIALLLPSLNPIIDWFVRHFHPQGEWRRIVLDFIRRQTKLALEARKQTNATIGRNSKLGVKVKFDRNNFKLSDGTHFRRNMIDSAIDKYIDGKLTEDELFNTSFLILLAADKTTTDAMVHVMYELAANPDEQERCREAVIRDGYEADYLAWSINEALRLRPAALAGCSRLIKRDLTIDNGHVVPAGSFVVPSIFTIHRLPEYWGDDADEFRPSRWKDTRHHHPLQFIPFGYGQRGCMGKEFALFEMKKVFAALLTRYKFEARRKDDAYVFDVIFLATIIPNSKTFVTLRRL